MQLDEYVDLFEQIEVNLTNPRIQQVLNEENFDTESFQNVIRNYISQADLVLASEGSKLFSTIIEKAEILLDYTKNPNFSTTIHNFFNTALYLSKHAPTNEKFEDENSTDNLISEEEFSIRYDNLVDVLRFEGEKSNLTLFTVPEEAPFQVFKNSHRSLVFLTRGGNTNIATKSKLINIVYHNGNAKNLSYEPVIIKKILDNSIFDHIVTQDQFDLKEVLKQGNEIFHLKSELEKLQKNEEQLDALKENLLEIIEQSKNAKNEYLSAKEAAVNDTKLKASVTYWKEKQKKHKIQFFIYGAISILLIVALIITLNYLISNHNSNEIFNEKNTTKTLQIVKSNHSDKNLSMPTALKSKIQDNKQTKNNDLNNPLTYFHFIGWYALIIFGSSSALWVIRIVVKISLSNLHLSEDAHERVVMIYTYLAFIEQGNGLEENDKQVILSSLFRPSNIGIIKDESSISVGDIISSLKSK